MKSSRSQTTAPALPLRNPVLVPEVRPRSAIDRVGFCGLAESDTRAFADLDEKLLHVVGERLARGGVIPSPRLDPPVPCDRTRNKSLDYPGLLPTNPFRDALFLAPIPASTDDFPQGFARIGTEACGEGIPLPGQPRQKTRQLIHAFRLRLTDDDLVATSGRLDLLRATPLGDVPAHKFGEIARADCQVLDRKSTRLNSSHLGIS